MADLPDVKVTFLLLAVSVFFSTGASARDWGADHKSRLDILQGLQRLFGKEPSAPPAGDCINKISALDWKELPCGRLMDGYCRAAWLPGTAGNFDSGASRFRMGTSPKGGLAAAERENLDVFLAAQPALKRHEDPLVREFYQSASPLMERLEWILSQEEDSDSWRQKLSEVSEEYEELKSDFAGKKARQLTAAEGEQGAKRKEGVRKREIQRKRQEIGLKILDASTEAKWAGHQNWRLVERSFEKAKRHLLEVIQEQPFPAPEKAMMLERIKGVTLHLPLSEPSVFGWRQTSPCASTQLNAFYTPLTNRVTMCAGLFNGYASEATLLGLLAHELGHSVDPGGLSVAAAENNSSTSLMRRLVQGGAKMECAEWSKARSDLLGSPGPVAAASHPMGRLLDCLVADFRTERRPWNSSMMEADAWGEVDSVVKDLAQTKAFGRLVSALEDGEEDADAVLRSENDYVHANCAHRNVFFSLQYAFLQEWRCSANTDKAARMKAAIAGASAMARRLVMDRSAECGPYCLSGPSAPSVQEHFSDWLAVRVVEKDLASIPASQKLTRAAEASMFWCLDPETRPPDEDGMRVPQRDLVSVHPFSGSRFRAFVSQKVREDLGCRIEEEEPRTYAECKP